MSDLKLRDLDFQIHLLVFGNPKGKVPHYTTNASDALEVLQECAKKCVKIWISKWGGKWFIADDAVCEVSDIETLPLAIAKFAQKLFKEGV